MTHSASEFSQEAVRPFRFEDPARHNAAMREVMEPVMLKGQDRQYFSGLYLNRDFQSQPLIAVVGAFLSEVDGPHRKYEGYQYAAAFPENPIQLIDLPAHGLSDPFTRRQRREILKTRTLSSVAESQAEALRSRHQNGNEIIAVGTSIGALIVPDLVVATAELDFKPRALVGHEMVGLDKRPVPSLLKAFYWDEWRYQRHYTDTPKSKRLQEAYEVDFKAELRKHGFRDSDYRMYGIYVRDPLSVGASIVRSPLISGHGFDVLKNVLDTHTDLTAALVSGGLSEINRWRKIAPQVEQMLDTYGERLSWDVWPFDSHNIGLPTQLPRLAAFTRAKVGDLAVAA